MPPTDLNPPEQYADERNLRARQRLWEHQTRRFDLVGWVLELAGLGAAPGEHRPRLVLDAGCGNGTYLRELAGRGVTAIGCDLSLGMLQAASDAPRLVNADLAQLPFRPGGADVVLAPHVLYHVVDRRAVVRELRGVLAPGGVCVAVTNGPGHIGELRSLVEAAVAATNPGWEMRTPATHAFSLANGEAQLRVAFDDVTCVHPPDGPVEVRLTDATIAADYVASTADHYQHQVDRPWPEVVADVRAAVADHIEAEGAFTVTGETGAFVCR